MEPSNAPVPAAGSRAGLGKREAILLAVLFALALALRLGWVMGHAIEIEFPDEKQYLHIADSFIRGAGLAVTIDTRTDLEQIPPLEMHRPPVYPLTLVLLKRLGLEPNGIRIFQAGVGALTCLMVWLLARELAGDAAAWVAGFLAAVDPFGIYFTGLILSETLFLLFFLTSWYYVARMWREASSGAGATQWVASCMLAGMTAALASLTRASALPLYALVPLAWLVAGPARRKGLVASALLLLVLLVGLSPWVARNYARTWDKEKKSGRIVLTTCNVGESLYEAVGPFATGGPNKENTLWPQQAEDLAVDECARDRVLVGKSIEIMRQSPARQWRLARIKLLRTWNIFPNYDAVRTPARMWVSAAFLVPVYLAALVGLGVLGRRRAIVWVLLPIVLWTLLHMVFVGSVRYRLPMMPLMFVLDGACAAWLVSVARGRRPGKAAAEKGPA